MRITPLILALTLLSARADAETVFTLGLMGSNAVTSNAGPFAPGAALEGNVRFENHLGGAIRVQYHRLPRDNRNWTSIQFVGEYHFLPIDSRWDVYAGAGLGDGFLREETTLDLIGRLGCDRWLSERIALTLNAHFIAVIGFSSDTFQDALRMTAGAVNGGIRFRF